MSEEELDDLPSTDTTPKELTPIAEYDFMVRKAKILAASQFLPAHFRGKPADCMVALELGQRLDVPAMLILQHSHVVKGKIGIEGKLAMALLRQRSPYIDIDVEYEGSGMSRQVTVSGKRKRDGKIHSLTMTMQEVQAWGWLQNDMWKKMPDQLLCYRAAIFFIRRYCPECLMGLSTKDELMDIETTAINVTERLDSIEVEK